MKEFVLNLSEPQLRPLARDLSPGMAFQIILAGLAGILIGGGAAGWIGLHLLH